MLGWSLVAWLSAWPKTPLVLTPKTHHTCRTGGDALDRVLGDIIQKHAQTAQGRSKLLQTTRALHKTRRHSCDACEHRMQRDMRAILDSLKGDEPDWTDPVGDVVVASRQVEELRRILAVRSA